MRSTAAPVALLLSACVRTPGTADASHSFGPRVELNPPVVVGPDSGLPPTSGNEWSYTLVDSDAYFLILRMVPSIDSGDEVTIDLGYDEDRFQASPAPVLYSRPIGGTSATITYTDENNNNVGSVELIEYGRGDVIDLFGAAGCTFQEPDQLTQVGICPYPQQQFPSVPSWVNVACDSVDGIVKDVSRSVGLFLFLTKAGTVSSCTATLVDENQLLTSGHCIGSAGEELDVDGFNTVEVNSASFTFDFESDCDGNCLPNYKPEFFKVTSVTRSKYEKNVAGIDYAYLVVDPSIITHAQDKGIEPIEMLGDTSGLQVGDSVFLVHHPTGRAKKVSDGSTDPGTCEILGFTYPDGIKHIIAGCDIDNGSSGASMFDAATGKIIANTDLFYNCGGRFILSSEILDNLEGEAPPPQDVDVVMVLDRSGSMGEATDLGSTKMEELVEAATMFVDLLELDADHSAGLVSFSTTPSLDYGLAALDAGVRDDLIQEIGDLSPGGTTSISGGLITAQGQFSEGSTNTPSILLMTDGLQNAGPSIQSAVDQLEDTKICSVGFGTDANLNGALLAQLAVDTNGLYTRANDGLELKKFFVLCFGNIFNENPAFDPYDCIPEDEDESDPIVFQVCDESNLTVVAGWESAFADFEIKLSSPNGEEITMDTPGVVGSVGETYAFLRLGLPFDGESRGTWRAVLARRHGQPPPTPQRRRAQRREDCFFLTSLVRGGPELTLALKEKGKVYYTGDLIIPIVALQSPTNDIIGPASVRVTVTRPTVGAGELLSGTGGAQGPPVDLGGDATSPRQDALRELQSQLTYVEKQYDLTDHDHKFPAGPPEPKLVFWGNLKRAKFEGEYTFHAIALYGREQGCPGRRELTWTVHVDVGIDPDKTLVDATALTNPRGGRARRGSRILVRFKIVPRDKFGNRLGPYRMDAFSIESVAGTVIVQDSLVDNGDGSYQFNVFWDRGSSSPFCSRGPGVMLKQPGREPALFIASIRDLMK